jgi:hypothetical protein
MDGENSVVRAQTVQSGSDPVAFAFASLVACSGGAQYFIENLLKRSQLRLERHQLSFYASGDRLNSKRKT